MLFARPAGTQPQLGLQKHSLSGGCRSTALVRAAGASRNNMRCVYRCMHVSRENFTCVHLCLEQDSHTCNSCCTGLVLFCTIRHKQLLQQHEMLHDRGCFCFKGSFKADAWQATQIRIPPKKTMSQWFCLTISLAKVRSAVYKPAGVAPLSIYLAVSG